MECVVYLTIPANSEDEAQSVIDRAKQVFPDSNGWYEEKGRKHE